MKQSSHQIAFEYFFSFPFQRLQNILGDTPVHEAINRNNPEILDFLLNNNNGSSSSNLNLSNNDQQQQNLVPLEVTNFQGFNCLHVAAKKGSLAAVKTILRQRPELAEVKKADGFTPLHLACLNGRLKWKRGS